MEYIGVTTHLLTIDPNFLGHPSMERMRKATFVRRGFIGPHYRDSGFLGVDRPDGTHFNEGSQMSSEQNLGSWLYL